MCDQFLDIKWIRQFPNGGWVGTVTTDVYLGAKKEQREQVVMQAYYQGFSRIDHNTLASFDVSESNFRGHVLEQLIKTSDYAFAAYWIKRKDGDDGRKAFAVESNGKLTEISKKRGYPNIKGSYTQETQNICVILPNEENGWLIENKTGLYGTRYLRREGNKK